MADRLPPPSNARTEPGHSREQVHLPKTPPPPTEPGSTHSQADGAADAPAPKKAK